MDRLDNTVQRYPWGNRRAIWDLVGQPPGEPGAELWMGAHPVAPSSLAAAGARLDQVIAQNPVAALGPVAAQAFEGRLPFLLKVLAAAQPLSLQAHPDPERARIGFQREEAEGVPRGSATRTYRDPSHKPELICAVTPFWACCGFRDLDTTRALLERLDHPGLDPVRQRLDRPGPAPAVLVEVLSWLLTLPPDDAAQVVSAVVAACAGTDEPGFEPERGWVVRLGEQYPGDPGVVVALLLNLVHLAPGEALFLGAGNLHCYLDGVGVEVMANSDNVVRGGFTTKHVDVAELLAVLDATPLAPAVQRPSGPVHTYDSPVPEFALTRIELIGPGVARPAGPRIVLVLEGGVSLRAGGRELALGRGQSAWVAAEDGPCEVSGSGLVFEASLGPG